jgi:hypothetical protein
LLKTPLVGVPSTGVTSVGEVANTKAPEPVSSVTAAARLAEEGVAKNVPTPVPRLDAVTTEENPKTPEPLVVTACPFVPSAIGRVRDRLLLVSPDCRVVVPVPDALPRTMMLLMIAP